MKARGSGSILNIIGMAGRANRASYISGSAANAALDPERGWTSFENLFRASPIPTMEQDYTKVQQWMEELRRKKEPTDETAS